RVPLFPIYTINFYYYTLLYSFFFYCSVHHPHLHSFPTRRSSDLSIMDLNHVLMVTVQSYSTEVVKKLTTLMYVHPMGQLLLFLLDRKSTRLNSSHVSISYAVFCLKKKKYTRSQNQDPIKVTS